MHRAVTFAVLISTLFIAASSASAFVHTLTCYPDPGRDPEHPRPVCEEGEVAKALFWDDSCAVIHTNQTGLPSLEDPQDVYAAIRRSLETWSDVSCSYFELIDGGLTNEDRVGYNPCDDSANVNIVVFRTNSWTHDYDALALTSVVYYPDTGEIVDADIEINNTGRYTFTTTDVEGQIKIDVQNTVTHEVGHFLGLDHTSDPRDAENTMYPRAPEGETKKRTLAADDIAGVCTIYPTGAPAPTCRPRNVGFFSRPEIGPLPPGTICPADRNCTCRLTDASPGSTLGLLVTLVLVAVARRRTRASI